MSDGAPASYDLAITGGTALTADPARPRIDDAVIGIRGGRIALIAPAREVGPWQAARKIDARGHVATPGFVNVHLHAILTMVRGMTEDMGFAPAYTPGVPHSYDVTEDEAVALARLGALETMLFGSTLINDTYIHAHATLPAMGELGLRVSASGWLHDVDFTRVHDGIWEHRPAIGERTLRYALDLAQRWQGAMEGRLSVMLAPHAPDTCTRELLVAVDKARRGLGLRVMTHCAQSRLEVTRVKERDGRTPVELLDETGLLDDHLIATHCLFATSDDVARLGRARANVAHPPKVNLTGGAYAPTSALRRAGANIAMATDAMHGDMVEAMRWALALGRLQEGGVTDFWRSEDVFHMGTLGAAQAMGRDAELGSLTMGKKADLVLFDFRRAHLTPALNPLGTLIHVGQGRDVAHVIVDGRIVVENGRATLVDEERIRREAATAAKALWDRAAS